MAKLRITNIQQLKAQNITAFLIEDLDAMHEVIRGARQDRCSSEALENGLNAVNDIYFELDAASQKELKELLQMFIFLLSRHRSKFVLASKASSSSSVDSLDEIIDIISDEMGQIPTKLSLPELPVHKFLPKKFDDTLKDWKKIPCIDPNRKARSILTGKIDFIKQDGKSSVRLQLEEDAKKSEGASVEMASSSNESELFYLNLVDFEYYKLGLMHADHLLPSESMIKRLKQMIAAMNYDPSFRQKMEAEGYFSEYFMDVDGEVVGNYWFYMAHHNSMENLWFLLASDNAGGGKLATDPIEWLESREIGKMYLDVLKRSGKHIDKTFALYKVSDGSSLKDSFIEWVEQNKRPIIKVCKELAKLHSTLRQDVLGTGASTADRKLRGYSSRQIGYHVARSSITKDNIDDDSSEGSMSSEKKRKFEQEFIEELADNPDFCEGQNQLMQLGHIIAKKVKTRMNAGTAGEETIAEEKVDHDDDGYDSTFSNNL